MINQMRKNALEGRAQHGQRQSPSLRRLTDLILVGNDSDLEYIGTEVERQDTQLENQGRVAEAVLSRLDDLMGPFVELYGKLSPAEKTAAQELIRERMGAVEKIANSNEESFDEIMKTASKKKHVALDYMLRNLPD